MNGQFDLKSIRTKADKDPANYVLDNEALKTAIQLSIWLGKPLLLTGAPGTGKTQLAYKVAHMLAQVADNTTASFLDIPFVFNTKTTSTATDLFYYYDAVRHFQQRHVYDQPNNGMSGLAHPFIRLNALGKAILQAHGKEAVLNDDSLKDLALLADFNELKNEPHSSVVLIDEIDKAPRDFPNDLLNEIENFEFFITELMNKKVSRPQAKAQVVVFMTSNFEKNLPDAFLRRCLFYHIPSPTAAELGNIAASRIKPYIEELYGFKSAVEIENMWATVNENMENSINEFGKIKDMLKDKKPATAELLDWIKALEQQKFFQGKVDFSALDTERKKILRNAATAIAKSNDDIDTLIKYYAG
jgi:MoxR-like ATPase